MHLQSFTFKYTHGDFIVKETLPFTPSGHGPLVYLNLQKSGKTTHDLLAFIMKTTGLRREAIGICGLKDKRGITQQRVSLYKKDLNKTGGVKNLLEAMQKTQYKLLHMTEDERFLTL
jgi:tRNA pseudouridine13 synthase